jgi:hypothetical protein
MNLLMGYSQTTSFPESLRMFISSIVVIGAEKNKPPLAVSARFLPNANPLRDMYSAFD